MIKDLDAINSILRWLSIKRAKSDINTLKQKFKETRQIKDTALKHHAENLIRIEYDPVIIRARYILGKCSIESIKSQRQNLLDYFSENFKKWITPAEVIFLYDSLLSPASSSKAKTQPSFSLVRKTTKNMAYAKSTVLKESDTFPNFCADLHIFPNDSKTETIKFLDDNWDFIQNSLSITEENKPKIQADESFIYEIIIRFLVSAGFENGEILRLCEVSDFESVVDMNRIRKKRRELESELENDWFSELDKQLLKNSNIILSKNFTLQFDAKQHKFLLA